MIDIISPFDQTLETKAITEKNDRKQNKGKKSVATKTKSKIQRHLLIHMGVKPYQCKVCNQEFRQKTNMTKHAESKHGNAALADEGIPGMIPQNNYTHSNNHNVVNRKIAYQELQAQNQDNFNAEINPNVETRQSIFNSLQNSDMGDRNRDMQGNDNATFEPDAETKLNGLHQLQSLDMMDQNLSRPDSPEPAMDEEDKMAAAENYIGPRGRMRVRSCELCGKNFDGQNPITSKISHMASTHFKEKLQADCREEISPFMCPANGCLYEASTRDKWSRHYGAKHGMINKYISTLQKLKKLKKLKKLVKIKKKLKN